MSAQTKVVVLAVDSSGASSVFKGAQVALVENSALGASVWPHDSLASTHSLSGDHYEPSSAAADPSSGEYLLVVRAKGHSTVVQRLTFRKSGEVVRALGGWGTTGPLATALTVSIVNFGEVKAAPGVAPPSEKCLITVSLFPVQYFVSLASPKNDATYQLFGLGRRAYLYDQGKLNAGAVALLMNAPKGETEVVVKSHGKGVDACVVVEKLPLGHPKMSITDFYSVLHQIGTNDPHSVVESAVWSHAWHQGPIIFNTGDEQELLVDRFPADTDGRPKDFYRAGAIASSFSKLNDAYTADGIFRIAGCSHMVNVSKEASLALDKLKAGTARSAFYEVPMPGGWLMTTLDHSKRSIGLYVQATAFARFDEQGESAGLATYLGRAAQTLTPKVFGAPPGCEGNMGTIRASNGQHLSTMKIVNVPYTDKQGNRGGFENQLLTRYYSTEFGPHFVLDELNYMDYKEMLKATLPNPGWNTNRSICMTAGAQRFLRVASGYRLIRDSAAGTFEKPVARTEAGLTGHLFVAKNAVPDIIGVLPYPDLRISTLFLGVKAKHDLGIFVTSTGKILLRKKEPSDAGFVPLVIELATALMDPTTSTWGAATLGAATDELQSVTPGCFW